MPLRNSSTVLDIVGKGGSVMFSAFRDDDQTYSEQNFLTFTGCHTNEGNGFSPKTGMFQCPEPGTYLFSLTVASYQGKIPKLQALTA